MQDHIRYDILAQEALRSVIRKVLSEVAATGSLPGDHHFFIGFATTAPGVRVSNRLRESYPEEMTVVLQHQFWDLDVSETGFSVSLSFNGVPERLVVPFSAIKGFLDPSVQFGLQFDPGTPTEANDAGPFHDETSAPEAANPGRASEKTAPTRKRPVKKSKTTKQPEPAPESSETRAPDSSDQTPGAEVVSLDQFRKKS